VEKEVDKAKLNRLVPERGYLEINGKGHLEFDGFDCVELAKEFGTPTYVISERKIKENYYEILRAFTNIYRNTKIAYAYKANSLIAVLKILKECDALAEVVSRGELLLANLVGVKGSDIVFNGPYKDRESIRLAIRLGALINVESFRELEIIDEEAKRLGERTRIGIRINPIVKTGTISEWETALKGSKFGIDLENALKAYEKAKEKKNIEVVGIHCHIGSQIGDPRPYTMATERIMNAVGEIKRKLGIEIQIIDLGGGFPIPFRYANVPPIKAYAEAVLKPFKEGIEKHDLNNSTLILEPGARIVGTSALLLLKVGIVKREESTRKWVIVDGGANVILRATQGWYVYQCFCCNKMKEERKELVNIGGPLCYSGDVIAYDRELPHLEEGDILAVLDCGAYTIPTLNRYNSYPFPAVVLIREDRVAKVIMRRETFGDLLINQELLF